MRTCVEIHKEGSKHSSIFHLNYLSKNVREEFTVYFHSGKSYFRPSYFLFFTKGAQLAWREGGGRRGLPCPFLQVEKSAVILE